MDILTTLFSQADAGLLALRLAIGAVFLYHGAPKLMKSAMMSKGMGLPVWFVFALGLAETLGGLGVILGVYTPLAAMILGIVMFGAIWFKIVKWKVPFYANDKTGWEFDFVLLAANIAIALTGGGTISLL